MGGGGRRCLVFGMPRVSYSLVQVAFLSSKRGMGEIAYRVMNRERIELQTLLWYNGLLTAI